MDDERAFLREIVSNPDADSARLVYADWLEERGETTRAEFLRLEAELARLPVTDSQFLALNDRLHELHALLDANWLALLDRTHIENCLVTFRFQCPKQWERLQTTDDDRTRFCESCHKNVHFCTTIDLARTHAAMGHCIAVDSRLVRYPDDLEVMDTTVEMRLMGVLNYGDFPTDPEVPTTHMLMGSPATRPRADTRLRRKRWWQFWK